jgi:hypothetical protein
MSDEKHISMERVILTLVRISSRLSPPEEVLKDFQSAQTYPNSLRKIRARTAAADIAECKIRLGEMISELRAIKRDSN